MIISISGFAGSGKTTIGKLLAFNLNYRFIAPSFKDLALKEGISLEEFQLKAEKNPNIDKEFDNYIKEEACKGNCVVATWLSSWIIDADLKVWLFAPLDVRAERVAKRDNLSTSEAKRLILLRENQNRERYLKLYKIDIFNTEIFDICINTATFTPQECVSLIEKALEIKRVKKNAGN